MTCNFCGRPAPHLAHTYSGASQRNAAEQLQRFGRTVADDIREGKRKH